MSQKSRKKFFIISIIVFALIGISGVSLISYGDNLSNRAFEAGICGDQPCSGNEVDTYGDTYYSAGRALSLAGGCGLVLVGMAGTILRVYRHSGQTNRHI